MILTTTLCAVNADNGMSEWAAAEIEEAVELGIVAEDLQKDYQKNMRRICRNCHDVCRLSKQYGFWRYAVFIYKRRELVESVGGRDHYV